jgi:hypothetical protein
MTTVSDDEVLQLWGALSAFRSGATCRPDGGPPRSDVRCSTAARPGEERTTGCSASRSPSRGPSIVELGGHAAGCSKLLGPQTRRIGR